MPDTRPPRVAIYARVSTDDRDQHPETQLLPLRNFITDHDWLPAGEFIDQAPAADLRRRSQWRELLQRAAKHQVDMILVWRLDRAFRSVLDAANTLEHLRGWDVDLRSYQEPWLDTTSPFGETLYYITAAYAQLERSLIAERVRAGMDRAKKQGTHVGRPTALARPRVANLWPRVRPRIQSGELTIREAARILGIGRSTVRRLLRESE